MKLTGPQRAAIVITQLDDARAKILLNSMSESDAIRLMIEVARLPALSADDVSAVTSDFTNATGAYLQVRQGGVEVAHRWLVDRLGAMRAAEIMADLDVATAEDPLSFLNRIEPAQIGGFLEDEHPQTIAIVLANLYHEHAARVLDHIDNELASDVVRRMATMTPVAFTLVRRIADVLEQRLANVMRGGNAAAAASGVSAAAAVLNNVDPAMEREILQQIEAEDPELAEVIRGEMFVFDDVAQLDDTTLQVVLRNVVLKDMALALKTATSDTIDRFLRCMSERAADDLREEVSSLGPQRLSAVEAAQAAVVKAVRELADNGTITIGRGSDELIV
ncbi:MAG: flagellar motor switch protein FliG [Acidimicrobiales bacterium]